MKSQIAQLVFLLVAIGLLAGGAFFRTVGTNVVPEAAGVAMIAAGIASAMVALYKYAVEF
ncbi:MAG: hypothetical protein EOP37_28645 [Rubrivivax sp.]|nr:MAG: hypothetical protein EOP37_28645 [Rubrivivax sp.]